MAHFVAITEGTSVEELARFFRDNCYNLRSRDRLKEESYIRLI